MASYGRCVRCGRDISIYKLKSCRRCLVEAGIIKASKRARVRHNAVRKLVDAGCGVKLASKLLGVEVTRELYDMPGDKVPAELQDKARALLAERGRSLVYETEVHPPLDAVRASSLPSSLGMLQDSMWGWGDYHRPG